ncbi:MAG: ABC transporter permease [Chloroflexi bacterium]|nr:ABC transporter permease [Chloroflexota bacterium]
MQRTQNIRISEQMLRQAAPVITLLVMMVFVGIITPEFLTIDSMIVLATSTATLFVLAAGATFVIMLGGIDLSIQAIASMCSVVLALTLPNLGYLAFILAIGAGLLAGTLSGLAHVRLRIPSFIATLAAGGVWAGVALIISDARAIAISGAERDYLNWITGATLGIPHEVFIGALVLVVSVFLQRFTMFGRISTAIGAGEAATWSSGVRVNMYKVMAFALSGLMAGLAGVILAGRLSSGSPTLADEFLLPAIAAVIVGGTALTGGVGSVWRTLIGALTISVIRLGMTFIGVDIFAQQIIFGVMLMIAVAITIDRSKIPIVK